MTDEQELLRLEDKAAYKKLVAKVTDEVFATLHLVQGHEYHWVRDPERLATWQLVVREALLDALATHLTRMAAERLARAADRPIALLLEESEDLRATLHTGVTALVTTEVARLLASQEPAA